jgi:hypothetical protein
MPLPPSQALKGRNNRERQRTLVVCIWWVKKMAKSRITVLLSLIVVSGCAADTQIVSNSAPTEEDLLNQLVYKNPDQRSLWEIFGNRENVRATLLERSLPCGQIEEIYYEQYEVVRCRNRSTSGCFDKFEVSKPVHTHKMTCCFGIAPEMIDMSGIAVGSMKTAGGTDPIWDIPVKVLLDEYQAEEIIALREGSPPLEIPVYSDCRGYWLENAKLRFGILGSHHSLPLFTLEEL